MKKAKFYEWVIFWVGCFQLGCWTGDFIGFIYKQLN